MSRAASLAILALLAGCAGGPPPPAWKADARQAAEAAIEAHFDGDNAAEARHFARARDMISRTGSPQRLARAELLRCAAHAASLQLGPCAGFEALRADAEPPERAYADYLAGTLQAQDVALLPAAQRVVAGGAGRPEAARAALKDIRDPLSRLVAAAVLLQRGQADPATIDLAVETASSQGWRRPLLAWLNVQLAHVQRGGDAQAADRVRRRIALAQGTRAQGR